MDNHDSEYLEGLLSAHNKRLQVLELRAAREGTGCPPEVLVEIQEIKKEVQQLQIRLEKDAPLLHNQENPFLSHVHQQKIPTPIFTKYPVRCGFCGTNAPMLVRCSCGYSEPLKGGHYYNYEWEILDCPSCGGINIREHGDEDYIRYLYPNIMQIIDDLPNKINIAYTTMLKLKDVDISTCSGQLVKIVGMVFTDMQAKGEVVLDRLEYLRRTHPEYKIELDIAQVIIESQSLITQDHVYLKNRRWAINELIKLCNMLLDRYYITPSRITEISKSIQKLIAKPPEKSRKIKSIPPTNTDEDLPF